jgi:hypothetical protein
MHHLIPSLVSDDERRVQRDNVELSGERVSEGEGGVVCSEVFYELSCCQFPWFISALHREKEENGERERWNDIYLK